MNNLIILFVIIITILLIFGVNLILKPETKKKGIFVISSIIILVIVRYCFINYTFVVDSFADSSGEDLTLILFFISMAAFASSPLTFLTGLFLAIKGSKYRKLGIIFMIFSIVAFLIGFNVCGQVHI